VIPFAILNPVVDTLLTCVSIGLKMHAES